MRWGLRALLVLLVGCGAVVLSGHPDSWPAFAGSPASAGHFSAVVWEMFHIQVLLFLLCALLRRVLDLRY